jgi:aminoglycoside phosphotransferase (APT) family kinase protein
MYREEQLQSVSKEFQIYGEILHAEPCKIGHINETYTATYGQGGTKVRYIHQKINKEVFKQPNEVMENVVRVTGHIRSKLEGQGLRDVTRRVITIVPTREGKPVYVDNSGDFWRTFVFVEGIQSFEAVESPQQAYEAGKAFGKFQDLLADLPGKRLHETIPDFHNSRVRFDAFKAALRLDRFNRCALAADEIAFCLENEDLVDVLLDAQSRGDLKERITHNDTKFNNVLMDVETGEERCVVDLDTVMPGLVLYDFGDMVRTTTSPTLEDEIDLSKVEVEMKLFEKLAEGYVTAASGFLTEAEKSFVAFSGKIMAFTIGLRFLTDYLSGDTYFRVHRPRHNLDRSRVQFKLARSIAEQEEEMNRFVAQL